MNKNLRKITTYIVLIAMFIGLIPTEILANSQSPVSSGLILTSNAGSAGYTVRAEWISPKTSVINPNEVNHPTLKFDIDIENMMTAKKEVPVEVDAVADDNGGKKYVQDITKDLDNGYLYKFLVNPYHYHHITDDNGNTTTTKAPMSPSAAIDNQAFFLTDIDVEGTGEGNSLTVIWDKPTDLITKYKISYNKILTSSSDIMAQAAVEVDINDPNLTIITDKKKNNKRYSYTITNESVISSANMYDITVEPIFNGGTYEVVKKNASLTENNKKIPVTVKDNGVNSGKYTCVITTDLPLSIEEIDSENLKLIWTGLDEATINSTDKLEILRSTDSSFDNYTIIGTLYNDGCRIGSWRTKKPDSTVYYKLVVTFKEIDGKQRPPMVSKVVEFNPRMIAFTPNKPDILQVKPIISGSNYQLDMIWSAFIRQPYTPDEEANTEDEDKKIYVDKDIKYDIWLSDDITGLYSDKILPILPDLSPDTINNLVFMDAQNNPIIAYSSILSQYAKKNDTGYELANLIPNKLYYIKIVAKKQFNKEEKVSNPEYLLVYFNDSGNVFLPPMMSKPPLKVKKDDKGNDMIGKTEVTVEWKTKWWEIYNAIKDEWESKFKVENGKLVFGFDGDGLLIKTEEDIKNKVIASVAEKVYYRPVIFDEDVKYEYKVELYSDIEKFAKDNYTEAEQKDKEKIYDDYIKTQIIPKETPTSSIFTDITSPTVDSNDPEKNTLYHKIDGLTSNTEYVILFRAYRTTADKTRLKSDPTYITITTLPEDSPIVEIPTVPSLYLKSKDDTTITVKWRDDGFKYELVISEKPLADPSSGKIITSEEIIKNGEKIKGDSELNANAIYYTITGLFPSTQYHIWVRAISDTAPKPSAWSSPLQVTTDALEKPYPPDGLGLASKESLLYINTADGKSYIPVDYNYIIFEWLKDAKDVSEGYTSKPAGNATTISGSMLGAPEIKATMVAMFSNLVANRPYYARVATRVTATKTGDGVKKSFSYIIQIADNDLFVDAVQIEIPNEFTLGVNDVYRTEISDFCKPIKIITAPDESEYDGTEDPDLYPLPEQDYELTYDAATDTLIYRLRSNEKDKDGMPDNRVDQRVISKLVKSGLYTYTIDVSTYKNKDVKNRVVEIPYTILEAFKERKINIKIKANNMTLILKPNWLSNDQARLATGYGDSSKLIMTIHQGTTGLINMSSTNKVQYISNVQQVNMSLQTPLTTIPIKDTAEPMLLQMQLNNRYDIYDKNISPYIYNKSSAEWERVDSSYDNQSASLNFSTNSIAPYTALAIEAPFSYEDSKYFKAISNKINITDMKYYNASQSVTANQLNNMLYSIANDKKDVQLNKPLTVIEKSSLSKSGLAIKQMGDIPVERQEAINSMVRLYEIKTGLQINAGGIDNSGLSDINNVSYEYLSGMLKAEEIGFIQTNILRPNEPITIDEMSYMINMILDDYDSINNK